MLLFATLILFSGVIIYEYSDELRKDEIETINWACKLIETWKNGPKDYSLTKASKAIQKPLLVFVRKNAPEDGSSQHS